MNQQHNYLLRIKRKYDFYSWDEKEMKETRRTNILSTYIKLYIKLSLFR